jgi:hypothetical protein
VSIEETIKARVAAFPFDLDLRYQDGESFMLLAPFEYRGRGICVRMEAGETTDFASIPKALRWLISPMGRHGRAAVAHDHCYRTGEYSRIASDAFFLEAMTKSGVWRPLRWVIYFGVRYGGRSSYQGPKEFAD